MILKAVCMYELKVTRKHTENVLENHKSKKCDAKLQEEL